MTKKLTPPKHANLIIEWAGHIASGAVDAGWYKVVYNFSGSWRSSDSYFPSWLAGYEYRIVMTAAHPEYKPPKTKIVVEFEFTDDEMLELARGATQAINFTAVHTTIANALQEERK